MQVTCFLLSVLFTFIFLYILPTNIFIYYQCMCMCLCVSIYRYVCVILILKKWKYLCAYCRFVVQKTCSLEIISIHISVGRSVSRTGVIFLKSEKLTQANVSGEWASYILSLGWKMESCSRRCAIPHSCLTYPLFRELTALNWFAQGYILEN